MTDRWIYFTRNGKVFGGVPLRNYLNLLCDVHAGVEDARYRGPVFRMLYDDDVDDDPSKKKQAS